MKFLRLLVHICIGRIYSQVVLTLLLFSSCFYVISLPQPAVVGGCFDGDAPLLYIVKFKGSRFNESFTTSTAYLLANIPKQSVLEITITPTIPFLRLTGPPLSTTVNLGKFYELLHIQLEL